MKVTKTNHTRKFVGLFALLTAALCLVVFSGESKVVKAGNNAEQLVFSTPGSFMPLTGNTSEGTPFGFWIWCAAAPSPKSAPPTYQAALVCQGSMYFYFLGVPEHVASAFTVKEDAEGLYTIMVFGKDFACQLNNTTTSQGPHDTVNVGCSFSPGFGGGTGTATVTNATVNTTGPKS
ncbi:MAG TPA: hypothetical protein VN951_00060 [Pyrinomonadaceae bacterium]|nr:hypothetical protein [Pyrinomonadaceae bacterium]